jgi:hypothetical protein
MKSHESLIAEMLKFTEELRAKQRYLEIQKGYAAETHNWEGRQGSTELLEEVCRKLEEMVATYIVDTAIKPNRRVNTLLRNACTAKRAEIQMSRI